MDELVYGKWSDRELMHDYLVGWLTHCLSKNMGLPIQDPRGPYKRFLRPPGHSSLKGPIRLAERETTSSMAIQVTSSRRSGIKIWLGRHRLRVDPDGNQTVFGFVFHEYRVGDGSNPVFVRRRLIPKRTR